MRYKNFIEENFLIVNKAGETVPFIFNSIQTKFLEHDYADDCIILKARQEGFSSLIDAIFTTDFILRKNSYSVIVADIEENAIGLLDRVKFFLDSYAQINKVKVPLKYNNRFELHNPLQNSYLIIGTAKNTEFGRSKTISNLHLSELAFFPNIEKILAGCGQAVVENGRKILETTANGFNEFEELWNDPKTIYKKLFYKASDFYSAEFLAKKRLELKETFQAEYPENDVECFLSSGQCYFDKEVLKVFLSRAQKPMTEDLIYA